MQQGLSSNQQQIFTFLLILCMVEPAWHFRYQWLNDNKWLAYSPSEDAFLVFLLLFFLFVFFNNDAITQNKRKIISIIKNSYILRTSKYSSGGQSHKSGWNLGEHADGNPGNFLALAIAILC